MYILSNNYIMNKIMEDNNSQGSNNSLTSNSENINENNKRCKKRSTKKEMYREEREEIIKKLNEIIGINKNNEIFLYDLERNEKVKDFLKNNILNVQKYYKCGTWGYFSNDPKKGSGNEITLLRSIYKNDDYDILSKRIMNEREGKKKSRVVLIFIKKT